jgi:hypothetical protein
MARFFSNNKSNIIVAVVVTGFICLFVVISWIKSNNVVQKSQASMELAMSLATEVTCPESPSAVHAKCSIQFVTRDFGCTDVKEEVKRRIEGKDGWKDPKTHPGTYKLIAATGDIIQGSRTTGDGNNYVDMFEMSFTQVDGGGGCIVKGCSVAQTMSVYDCKFSIQNIQH